MPRMPRRKRWHVSLLPMVRHAKHMLFDQRRRGSSFDRQGGSGSPVHTTHHIPGKQDYHGKEGRRHDLLGAVPFVTNHRRRRCMATVQPRDIVQFLCWLGSCSNRRRTVVHAMHCTRVGTAELSGCLTQPGECAKRYAHDSLRKNYVSKLAVAYERDLGITTDWNDALRIGNPIRSDTWSHNI